MIRIANPIRRGRWWRLVLLLGAWAAVAAPAIAGWTALRTLRGYARDLPAAPDLDAWEQSAPQTSLVLAADGTVLAELPFRTGDANAPSGHRLPVAYADLPRPLIDAVLAAEDARFFAHRGVDGQAVARAAWANYRAGRVVEGASTITQQVARNLLPEAIGTERSLRRKVREALLARRLERRYDKRRIFETYLNHVFLGSGAYGVGAAARAYFDKPLAELDLAECALIAGLIQAPGRANPYRNLGDARQRRDQVLRRMARAGFIAADEAERAAARPIVLSPPPVLYGSLAPWLTERARQAAAAELGPAFDRGGLVIQTTAQPLAGARAEGLANDHASRLAAAAAGRRDAPANDGAVPQVGALLWDHHTGYVELVVGGRDWTDSQFDRTAQACRQPGSAFKPLVYAAALEAAVITPGTPLRDAPIAEWDEEHEIYWKPTNSGRSFRGVALAHEALVLSLNAPAVDVLDRVGARRAIDVAHRLGITSPLVAVRPLVLGASCVVALDLTRAFAAFARGGAPAAPVFASGIWRGDELLVDHSHPADPTLAPARRLDSLVRQVLTAGRTRPVLSPTVAYQMSAMLTDAARRGTGKEAARAAARGAVDGRPVAGKTGTTNSNTDAWFVGYTGRVVASVWLGHDNPARALGRRQDGGRAAAPLWGRIVAASEADRPVIELPGPAPDDLVVVSVDRETGLRARPGSGGATELHFAPGTEPVEQSDALPDVSPDLSRLGRDF